MVCGYAMFFQCHVTKPKSFQYWDFRSDSFVKVEEQLVSDQNCYSIFFITNGKVW